MWDSCVWNVGHWKVHVKRPQSASLMESKLVSSVTLKTKCASFDHFQSYCCYKPRLTAVDVNGESNKLQFGCIYYKDIKLPILSYVSCTTQCTVISLCRSPCSLQCWNLYDWQLWPLYKKILINKPMRWSESIHVFNVYKLLSQDIITITSNDEQTLHFINDVIEFWST